MGNSAFYAVYRGRKTGVFDTWPQCQEQVKNFKGAVYKKFTTFEEASAFSKTAMANGRNMAKLFSAPTPTPTATAIKRQREDDHINSSSSNTTTTDTRVNKRPHTTTTKSDNKTATKAPATLKSDTENYGPIKVVYTDGASSNNGTKQARAGYGVYWGDGDPRNASVRLDGDRQTNQRAETMAIIHAVEQDLDGRETLEIRTDSQYAINSLTKWCVSWQDNKWASSTGREVQNKDIFVKAIDVIKKRKGKVIFTHVAGHSGIKGNEEADRLAVLGATLPLKKQ